ncbi:MAG: DNA gyrase inhibitor YacG [Steroidobacteraceae bacterium]
MATVACPTCRAPVEWSDASPYRPFCSERCRLIDLGEWMSERHVIPGEPTIEAIAPDSAPDDPPRH